ncbi:MAG: 3-methyl-2-oxobutanoate hydroxymethyltransferase [Candidatus Omnitrophica bacterium]|nr:3-methyl-2-oxobutanoate hydroxymethyltransferase [Candidatus Omnitrophota bacterium]
MVKISSLKEKKRSGVKITMLTAYDYSTARIVDEAGIDIILVGDSLGMVVLGYDSTVPVTMEDMIHHAKAVRRGTKNALLVGDMPFKSYHTKSDALRNANRFVKEAGCDAVKLEGGTEVLQVTSEIVRAGIPVMGHLGLTPQSATEFKVQGKDAASANKICTEAIELEKAGCFSVVLECIPDAVAKIITDRLTIPTIGIGAGPSCDGQVLVINDLVGLFDKFVPKFVKQYAKISVSMSEAVKKYKEEVEKGIFPDEQHSFTIKSEELKKLKTSGDAL